MQGDREARSVEEGAAPTEPTSAATIPSSGGPPARGEPTPVPGEAVYRVSGASLAFRYLVGALLTLVGVLILYAVAPTYLAARDVVVIIVLGFWALVLLRYWVYLFDMPHKVICREDGTMTFLSVLRRRVVPAGTILSMNVSPLYPTYLKFRTSKQKRIVMVNHVDGLHKLVNRIREANPDLKTKGC